jgi:transcription-repair coupling factor (superfamily II helicase)
MELHNLIEILKQSDKYKSFVSALSPQTPYKISGLNSGAKALWLSPLLEDSPGTLLIIVSSKEEEEIFTSFFDYLGFKDYDVYPTMEISPYEQVITDINLLDKQYQVIEKLLKKQVKCVITKTRALNQKLPSIRDLTENIVTVRATQEISPLGLTEELIRLGYKPAISLEKRGQFSRKGGTITIYPVGFPNPVKISWFDDEIEFIKEYDIETNKTKEEVGLVTLYPVSKLVLPRQLPAKLQEQVLQSMMTQIVNVYSRGHTRNAEDLRRRVENSLNNLKNFEYDEATYSYFNYLYTEGASLLDYLPANSIVVWSEFTNQNSLLKKFEETIEETLKDKYEKGLFLETTGQLYVPLNDILKKARNFSQLRCSSLNDMPNVNLQFSGTLLPVFTNKFDELVNTLKKWSQQDKKRVLIISVQPQRALTLLRERDCAVIYGEEPGSYENEHGIWVFRGEITKGFAYPDLNLVVLTDSELFGWSQRPLKKKSKEKKDTGIRIAKVQDIKIDDYVVHEIHGIGQYKGLRVVELEGRKREYFELIYSKNDKLLVPIEQINLLSLYRGSTDVPPRLSKMGGSEWENLKTKIKDSVKNIAGELIELYARRVHHKGYSFPPDTEWQGQMEDAFPYDETPDQLQAIQETKADMERPRPMDRLVCGDVGFGKTEVAIRAAFKGVMSGKQVAVLAPTTVLSQQLYDVFHQRFAPYPVKIAILNRFRTASESKQIYEDVKKGNLDIIVSTHRILMKTPEFYDLGLVIVDEEHKFGVAHKEKLKQFKTSVDVMSMSATPIPRTLYMALSGARDMSLIETPPQNRFPIQTKLSPFNKELIRNAILHELERGGQVYFVHNRVESLGRVHRELKELLPDVSIGIGHGQLPEHELENVMLGFNNREYDVLLCTTIIESGLDIPSANTIIIDQVQLLGLAQLYQLRGRVGRSDIQAYAYFLYPENLKLTDEARQRLQVIQDMSELGSGYQIALRDMEIRGVGDLLGSEQHGNVLSVGYDTFCQILEETVNELKPEDERTSNYAPTVIIDINLPCYIPDNWITDYRLKMQAYRRLAVVQDLDLLAEMHKELKDNYGEPPSVTENLFKIVKIRILASKLGITSIKSINKALKVKIKIPEKSWRDIVNKNSDLMRWQWSLEEISTKASASAEGDVNLLEKFLNIVVNTFKKEEEKAGVA